MPLNSMNAKIISIFCFCVLVACTENKAKENVATQAETTIKDSVSEENFIFVNTQDTLKVMDGEKITRYKNGVIEKQGMMKNGKRDGLWKSFYENGTPWSETTFKDGIKNGKTTTWYPNGQMRYDGFYTNDVESGKWTFYDEKGNIASSSNYDNSAPPQTTK